MKSLNVVTSRSVSILVMSLTNVCNYIVVTDLRHLTRNPRDWNRALRDCFIWSIMEKTERSVIKMDLMTTRRVSLVGNWPGTRLFCRTRWDKLVSIIISGSTRSSVWEMRRLWWPANIDNWAHIIVRAKIVSVCSVLREEPSHLRRMLAEPWFMETM